MTSMLLSSVVEWSRWQFALTAIFHWFFVPLTLGITFMLAIMETIYVKTGDEFWKKTTKFWMKIFGINFAIGVATGIILEFEFGTNWSNYSYFVGDIFGAPLAIEGILAFFMESTFIAIMFFGWNKVGKRTHLAATWLTAIGANLSALWILVANGWMQYPTGMAFNPETMRNEMVNFWKVLFSPVAINKFFHTVTSGYVLAAIVVMGISAWFLLKKRNIVFAKKSILIAAVFGLFGSAALLWTGDGSAYQVAQKQPMKSAAMEGLYDGKKAAGLVALGVLTPGKEYNDSKDSYIFKIEIPYLLSFLSNRDFNSFVPGIKDLINGGFEYIDEDGNRQIAPSFVEKRERGQIANQALIDYKDARERNDATAQAEALKLINENFRYFGYAHLTDPSKTIPNVPLVFYSFHIMVILGCYFVLLFIVVLWLLYKDKLHDKRWLLWLMILTIPLVYLASQAGWIVAEVGRQPWVIQDLMPTIAAASHIDVGAVQTTFILFFGLFTILLIAELGIMFKQIKKGPESVQ